MSLSGFVFWGLQVPAKNKQVSYKVPAETVLHLSNASLGAQTQPGRNVLKVHSGAKAMPVSVLTAEKVENATFDLIFPGNKAVTFSVEGKSSIFLSGYLQPLEDELMPEAAQQSASEEEPTEAPQSSPTTVAQTEDSSSEEEQQQDSSSSEEDDSGSEMSESDIIAQRSVDLMGNGGSAKKKQQQNGNKRKAETAQPQSANKKAKKAASATTPAADKTQTKDAKTPQWAKDSAKKDAKKKTPKSEKKDPFQKGKGGLQYRDIKAGTGKPVKKGRKLQMRYIGRLCSNGKVFDSNLKGQPFTFRLGAGEVIKGWDMGLEGMKVGGKRILKLPSKLAYGKSGAGRDIPPNADLEFVVEVMGQH